MNHNLKQLGTLLAPSILSAMFITGTMIALSLSILIKYGTDTRSFYSLLLGEDSSPTLLGNTRAVFSAFYETVFSNPTLNKIMFFVFWMLIGLLVYLLLMGLGRGFGQADETLHKLKDANTNRLRVIEWLGIRLGVRLAAIAVTVVYSIFFVKLLLPFALLTLQIAAGSLPALSAFGYGAWGLLLLGLSLHVYVILLRLVLLRLRVFD